MPSMFGRLTRYQPLERFNPRETQRTEALAAVLEADAEVARAFTRDVPGLDAAALPDPVRVRTQAPAGGLDRIDLELRSGAVGVPETIVWFEVKVDAELSGADQLHRYWSALHERPAQHRELVLLQRWDRPVPDADQRPGKVRLFDWLRAAESLSRSRADGFAGGLVADFLAYLREGDLAMTDPLGSEHLVALEHFTGARTVLERITRGVFEALRAQYDDPTRSLTDEWERLLWRVSGPDCYTTFSLPAPSTSEAWLEFDLMPGEHLDGGLAFGAGVAVELGKPLADSEVAREAFAEQGFEPIVQFHQRFFRFKRPPELLAAGTLDSQVELLRSWAVRAFEDGLAVERRLAGPRPRAGA